MEKWGGMRKKVGKEVKGGVNEGRRGRRSGDKGEAGREE